MHDVYTELLVDSDFPATGATVSMCASDIASRLRNIEG